MLCLVATCGCWQAVPQLQEWRNVSWEDLSQSLKLASFINLHTSDSADHTYTSHFSISTNAMNQETIYETQMTQRSPTGTSSGTKLLWVHSEYLLWIAVSQVPWNFISPCWTFFFKSNFNFSRKIPAHVERYLPRVSFYNIAKSGKEGLKNIHS